MRLIDADELKTCFQWSEKARLSITEISKIIDNAQTVTPKDRKWFDCIDNKLLKSRHGDFVIYKVDFLLDNLTREVYIMEGARKMRGFIDGRSCVESTSGTWKYKEYDYYCSNCGNNALEMNEYPYLSSYCPFCGAEMEIEQ